MAGPGRQPCSGIGAGDTGVRVWSKWHLSSFYRHLLDLVLLSQHLFEVGHNIPTLQMSKMRLREVKQLASSKVPKLVSARTRIQTLQPEPLRQATLIPRHGRVLSWGRTQLLTHHIEVLGWSHGRRAGRNLLGGCCRISV